MEKTKIVKSILRYLFKLALVTVGCIGAIHALNLEDDLWPILGITCFCWLLSITEDEKRKIENEKDELQKSYDRVLKYSSKEEN